MAGNYRWVKPARGKDKYFAFDIYGADATKKP